MLSLMYVQFSWQNIEFDVIPQYLLQSEPSDLIFVKCSFEFSPIQMRLGTMVLTRSEFS